ncbi:MAG: type II secretion system F family protein [Candidatus Aenigmatarchaeota archaeon]
MKYKIVYKKLLEEEYNIIKRIALMIFGKLVDKYFDYFKSLKKSVLEANFKILFRTYLALAFFTTTCFYILTILITLVFSIYFKLSIISIILSIIFIPIIVGVLTFLSFYFYPSIRARKRKNEIEANLPFTINNMAAIASSGVPPSTMFKVLSTFKEYGEISKEAGKIARNIEVFGLDEITAIKEVIVKTPSREFKDILEGILTTVQTGGSLKDYLKEEADKAMFDYRIKRQSYTQMLSMYADFYTALLIAAPLIFIAILSVLNIIGGTVFGLPIQDLIRWGVFVFIPLLNIAFLIILNKTQPKV